MSDEPAQPQKGSSGARFPLNYTDQLEPEPATGFRRACGVALSALGMLILALSGACAFVFMSPRVGGAPVGTALIVAAPFMIIGLLLWLGGDRLKWRK